MGTNSSSSVSSSNTEETGVVDVPSSSMFFNDVKSASRNNPQIVDITEEKKLDGLSYMELSRERKKADREFAKASGEAKLIELLVTLGDARFTINRTRYSAKFSDAIGALYYSLFTEFVEDVKQNEKEYKYHKMLHGKQIEDKLNKAKEKQMLSLSRFTLINELMTKLENTVTPEEKEKAENDMFMFDEKA